MRKLITLALVAAAVPMMAAQTTTSVKTSATAPVKVRIIAPCHIQSDGKLDFGTVMMDEYNKAGAVGVIPSTNPNGGSQVSWKGYNNCSAFKSEGMSVPEFHYRHDANFPVNILVEGKVVNPTAAGVDGWTANAGGATVNMAKGILLQVGTDMPSDACGLFTPIAGVTSRHFGLGGVLQIPAGVYGVIEGSVTVAIAYQ